MKADQAMVFLSHCLPSTKIGQFVRSWRWIQTRHCIGDLICFSNLEKFYTKIFFLRKYSGRMGTIFLFFRIIDKIFGPFSDLRPTVYSLDCRTVRKERNFLVSWRQTLELYWTSSDHTHSHNEGDIHLDETLISYINLS